MNYGKNALEKKLKNTSSKTRKYTSMIFFGFFKTMLLLAVVCAAALSFCISQLPSYFVRI